MVAEGLIHSWDSFKTWEAMEKLILSYLCIYPWSNMKECDGVKSFSNSVTLYSMRIGCMADWIPEGGQPFG
jgi:hypothetical protein